LQIQNKKDIKFPGIETVLMGSATLVRPPPDIPTHTITHSKGFGCLNAEKPWQQIK
jgi:hypothetical protein